MWRGKLEQQRLDKQKECQQREKALSDDEEKVGAKEEALLGWRFRCMPANPSAGTATGCALNRRKKAASTTLEKIPSWPLTRELRAAHISGRRWLGTRAPRLRGKGVHPSTRGALPLAGPGEGGLQWRTMGTLIDLLGAL
jgi:hypothetical protein